jgi:hypothetical protein
MNISNYQADAFVGISHLFLVNGGFGDNFATTGKTINEVPVAQDGGFTYNGGQPSIDHYKIHGMVGDWASRMTPGDTEINLFIPTMSQEVLTACGFTVSSKTAGVIADSDAGDYKFTASSGFIFSETQKAFSVGIAVVNDEGTKLFAIKKVKLLASIVFDSADTAKPIGISLTGASSAATSPDAMGIFEGTLSVVEGGGGE